MNKINPSNVPVELRSATTLAEKWGVAEEGERIQLAQQASDDDLKEFQVVMHNLDIQFLLAWLPEVGEPMSLEQAIFMYLALAVDAVEMEVAKRKIDY